MYEVSFVDTTLRDGHASLWAEGMTTGMMVPIAAQLDRVGFKSVELMGSSHFKKAAVELHENPWDRIRLVSKRITKTPLSIIMRGSISFDITPLSLLRLFLERIAANGIKIVELMEPSNDMGFKIPETIQFIREVGLKVTLAVIYSQSPKHTDEHFAEKTRDAVKLKPDTIYLKDPGGLLTPERMRTLIPVMMQNANGIPLECHSHCTTGLAPLCYLEAFKLGVQAVHTSIPPLANGSAQPSVFNVARNAHYLGFDPKMDLEAAQPVSDHFKYIAENEHLPIGAPLEYDYYQYIHQVPGGVISNLKHQLKLIKMDKRLDEVLEETVRVRQDLGYPIMVTPFSQFVVSQAAVNVQLGRYKQVIDGLTHLVLGFWGKEARDAIDPNVRDRIMSLPKAKELAKWEPPEPSLEKVRQELGAVGGSDEELLLRYMTRDEKAVMALRSAGPVKEYETPAAQALHS
jgi:oxaloacetate decarboxylase alpha subunit